MYETKISSSVSGEGERRHLSLLPYNWKDQVISDLWDYRNHLVQLLNICISNRDKMNMGTPFYNYCHGQANDLIETVKQVDEAITKTMQNQMNAIETRYNDEDLPF